MTEGSLPAEYVCRPTVSMASGTFYASFLLPVLVSGPIRPCLGCISYPLFYPFTGLVHTEQIITPFSGWWSHWPLSGVWPGTCCHTMLWSSGDFLLLNRYCNPFVSLEIFISMWIRRASKDIHSNYIRPHVSLWSYARLKAFGMEASVVDAILRADTLCRV